MSKLFEPLRIRGLELENRFVRSATWDASAVDESGAVTDASVAIHEALGRGGIGLIISGYAFISPQGRAASGQYGIHSDEMIPGLRRLTDAAHRGGGKIAAQIVHAGAQSRFLPQRQISLLAVSSLPHLEAAHREMTEDDIGTAIDEFVAATTRAREANFDAVQFHGAHGFLFSQFLSPRTNHRLDGWGGDAERRRRFPVEVARRVRRAVGDDFPLLIKLGVHGDREGGLSLEEGVEAARALAANGIDAIEISSARAGAARVKREGEPDEAYLRPPAAAVKKAVAVPVIVVGGVRTLAMAEDIVASGDGDLIAMSRPFIREPDLIARWRSGRTEPAKCISCNKCFAVVERVEPLECGEERALRGLA